MKKFRLHWFPGHWITLALAAPVLLSFDSSSSKGLESAQQIESKASLKEAEGYMINFNNIQITEYIRFISKISGKNFIFDENELKFNVTIVSEAMTQIDDIMAALVQNLRIKGLTLLEQGNNLIIHASKDVAQPFQVVTDENQQLSSNDEFITRVFRVMNVSPEKMAGILRPMLSKTAILEVLKEAQHIIVTDLATNLPKLSKLVTILDSPHSGYEIGQYSASGTVLPLIALAEKIMTPISADKTLVFIPHLQSNSIYIVSTPYLVEKTLTILQTLDRGDRKTRMLSFENLQFSPEAFLEEEKARLAKSKETVESRLSDPISFTMQPIGITEDRKTDQAPVSIKGKEMIEMRLSDSVGFVREDSSLVEKRVQDNITFTPSTAPLVQEERAAEVVRIQTPDGAADGEDFMKVENELRQLEDTPLLKKGIDNTSDELEWEDEATALSIDGPRPILPKAFEVRLQEEAVRIIPSVPVIENRQEDELGLVSPGEESNEGLDKKRADRRSGDLLPLATDADFSTSPRNKLASDKWAEDVPFSESDSTLFYVYKLEFRGGEQIESALKRIGASLKENRRSNADLMNALTSVQLIPSSNSLIFSGSPAALPRMVELIQSMDVPLRQVLIEVLVLDTSISDSVNFGVSS
ncbi:MAG: gspD, partial [Chlamydiales bacterium]|nr:gspD [Chlamydiales bacterium]